jgi:glutamate synthase domain-containing protein 1
LPRAADHERGDRIEIYKEVGLPRDVAARFDLPRCRAPTASATPAWPRNPPSPPMGAHPFSTGPTSASCTTGRCPTTTAAPQAARDGVRIETENDTEVGAAYLTWKMQQGATLGRGAGRRAADLDGFFTFVVGTRDGFGVVRDPIACKPAVMAETDQYVAFGSEYRALVNLPGIEAARVWEPEPATVYFWTH